VAKLHSEFVKLPGDGNGITLPTLRRVLWDIAPNHIAEQSCERLFELMDRDGSGSLDFLELMTGILVLREGNPSKKLDLLFELYNTDGSGHLHKDELLCLAKALFKLSATRESTTHFLSVTSPINLDIMADIRNKPLSADDSSAHLACAEQFRRRLLLLDTSGTGRVSLEDFRRGVPCDEILGRCLSQVGARITEETECHPLLESLTCTPRHLEDPVEMKDSSPVEESDNPALFVIIEGESIWKRNLKRFRRRMGTLKSNKL